MTDQPTPATPEVIHACPPDGSGLTPCCGRTPFELPLTDRVSSEAPVTCTGPVPVPDDSRTTADGNRQPLRGEFKPWQLLGEHPDERLPEYETVIGGRRLSAPDNPPPLVIPAGAARALHDILGQLLDGHDQADPDGLRAALADANRLRADAQRDRDQHAAVLRDVLSRFVHETHPGEACLQSAHVPVATVQRWRAVVAPTAEAPWWEQIAEERARADRAESELVTARSTTDRVRALHTRANHGGGDVCTYCSTSDYPDYEVPFPCRTIAALDEPGDGPADTECAACDHIRIWHNGLCTCGCPRFKEPTL